MRKNIFIIFLLMANPSLGQHLANNVWLSAQAQVAVSKKWQWHHDAGYRTVGYSVWAQQYFYRTGLRYLFNKKWSAAIGTADFVTRVSAQKTNHEFGNEFRLWQEGAFNIMAGKKNKIQQRLRTEERWFGAVKEKEAYAAFRLRYRLMFQHIFSAKWNVQLADEYMHQYAGRSFSFNQNRIIAALNYNVHVSTQLQVGYMFVDKPGSSQQSVIVSVQKNISWKR
jgi:hypothetical protein